MCCYRHGPGRDLAECGIRVSGGWATTEADWARFADAWLDIADETRGPPAAPPKLKDEVA